MVTSDFSPEVEIRPSRACAMKNMQYNPYIWPNCRNFSVLKNTFSGTWYLPHSDRAVPIIMAGCIAHAWNGHISTSALKYDVAIVFLDPDFL